MSSKLLKGAFILTLGTIISRVLGLLYVIPFYKIVGPQGTILYSYAYVPYTIFISIATAGVPMAISKFISKYNTLEEYAVGRRLFKSGLVVMLITGFLAFLGLFFAAPMVAELVIQDKDQTTSVEDVVTVIRAVSFALIIVPFMSMLRGFFQGHQSMAPTAVSQVIEQIFRIVFLLIGAFIVLFVMNGTVTQAVSLATFAAFIGAIGGLGVLLWYWYKRKSHFNELLQKDKGTVNISLRGMYKEVLFYSLPFVFVGLANPLFQLVDQFTFNRAMVSIGLGKVTDYAYSVLNFESHKIVTIPVSLAIGFSLTLVPSITKAFIEKNQKDLFRQLNQTFQVVLFLTLPVVVGIGILAEPVFTVFYEHKELGTEVLRTYSPVAILLAMYSVTAAILQGLNEQRYSILSLLVGLLVKLSLNIPLIKMFETVGSVYATALGYLAAILINLYVIRMYSRYPFRLVIRRMLLIILFTLIMFIGTKLMYSLLVLFLSPSSTIESLLIILICAVVGAIIYFYLGYRSKLIYFLFGKKADRLKQKLRLPF